MTSNLSISGYFYICIREIKNPQEWEAMNKSCVCIHCLWVSTRDTRQFKDLYSLYIRNGCGSAIQFYQLGFMESAERAAMNHLVLL